ncbi:MAG: Cof-type HAD-IIB family hydrolase [Leptotrichiaceae bacterium]|nr:Cof-type HAD-IIB family hydrolase [Leptotrichiaceae bacterium]
MKIKAVFMDLDGTLLKSNHTISEKLKDKLKELEEKGIKIFISTGRSFKSSYPFVKELGITTPVITYNGGRIVIPETGEAVYEKPVSEENVRKIIEISREKGIHLNLYNDDELYIEQEDEEGTGYAERVGIPYCLVNFDEFAGKTSTKGLFLADNGILTELKKELDEKLSDVNFVFSQPTYLEVLNKEVNKGTAVLEMLKKYDISPDEAMTFGDQWNDLEMLKSVKYGYLMGNATEELKNLFPMDRITSSNDDDGIYNVLENIVSD